MNTKCVMGHTVAVVLDNCGAIIGNEAKKICVISHFLSFSLYFSSISFEYIMYMFKRKPRHLETIELLVMTMPIFSLCL